MKRNDAYKKALVLILGVCLLSGCAPSVDNKDPLSDYTVDSILPFDTNQVTATDTPVPQPTATPTVSPVDQNWQNDNNVGDNTAAATNPPQQTTQKVPLARLELGSTGDGVVQLQERLIALGYLSGTADGNFGSNTKTAVKRFQAALGLSQTGVATVTLQEKLFLSTAPTYSPALDTSNGKNNNNNTTVSDNGYTTLIRGDKGDGVTKLQQRLIALGYLSGSADGSFGTKTENAVKRFQAALGLTQNGVASASLQQSLFSANAPIAVATAAPRVTQAPSPTKAPSTGGTTTSGYVDLEYGDKSDAVKRLQQRLKELGYFDHTATGKYYSETEAAVKRFQAALGLTQTGVATASLQTKLFASNAPMAQETASPSVTQAPSTDGKYTTLTRGSTGEEVRALQKRLIALGYLTGKADGDYGKATENAIKLFQKSIGYNENGTATEAVQEYLFSPYAPTYTAPASTATGAPAQPTQAPAQTEYTELRHGDTGDAVKRLQKRLKELGYFNGEIGGNYLDKTEAAVKLFESAIGWNTDGVATVVLQQYLFSAQAPAYDVAAGYGTLEKGDTGAAVKKLQQRLIDLGYLTGKADGDFGAKTKTALEAFQAAIGLSPTGVADPDTQEYLYASTAPSAPTAQPSQPTQAPSTSGYQTLSYGVSGEAVKNLQRRLKELGYFSGNVAGNYKDLTQAAVVAFQQAIGWTADGIATPELQEYLFSSNAPSASSDPGDTGDTGDDGSYTALTYGEQNSRVKRLQQRLIELGWLSGGADGEFGQNTLNAVTALQYRFGMEQSGIATVELQERLFAADAPEYVEYEELTVGMTGDQVLALQERLIELGYLRDADANRDGEFGEGTRSAVINVQQAMGLIGDDADGVATVEFQTFLFSDFALEYKIEQVG